MAEAITEAENDLFLIDEEEYGQENKYLLFRLGSEIYGFSISYVTDIIEMQKITQVPDLPDYIKGVINLRGKVLPIMDLRIRFGMETREYDTRTCIIILEHGKTVLGVIVDTVFEVAEIEDSLIGAPPEYGTEAGKRNFIKGLAKTEGGVQILLDEEKILRRESTGGSHSGE